MTARTGQQGNQRQYSQNAQQEDDFFHLLGIFLVAPFDLAPDLGDFDHKLNHIWFFFSFVALGFSHGLFTKPDLNPDITSVDTEFGRCYRPG